MTKQTSKLVTDAVITASAAAPAAQPQVVVISERTPLAFAAAAVLIRSGYVVSLEYAPVIFPSTSQATITLVRGNPDAHAVSIAEAAEAHAAAKTQVDFDKAVESAAARMLEQRAKEAKQAEIAAVVAANKAQIARLEAEMNAAK